MPPRSSPDTMPSTATFSSMSGAIRMAGSSSWRAFLGLALSPEGQKTIAAGRRGYLSSTPEESKKGS